MSEPRTAEDWSLHCEQVHRLVPVAFEDTRPTLLCVACARDYARQVGEAWREEAIQEVQEAFVEHGGQRAYSWNSDLAQRIIQWLRALPVETP